MKLRFYFDQRVYADEVAVYLIGEKEDGRRFIAKPMPIEFMELQEGLVSEPTLTFRGYQGREFLPALADALNNSGFKASKSDDGGELRATKYHLEDMRKLALEK